MEDRTIIYIILILISLWLVTFSFGTTEDENKETVQNGVLVEHSMKLKDGRNVTCVTFNEEDNQKGLYRDDEYSQKGLSCDWEHAQ